MKFFFLLHQLHSVQFNHNQQQVPQTPHSKTAQIMAKLNFFDMIL